jgi:hypothetical protein
MVIGNIIINSDDIVNYSILFLLVVIVAMYLILR